jgi:hypothetical protein
LPFGGRAQPYTGSQGEFSLKKAIVAIRKKYKTPISLTVIIHNKNGNDI